MTINPAHDQNLVKAFAQASGDSEAKVIADMNDIAQKSDISKWSNTQTTRETACPKCNAAPGNPCRTPKGRKALEPHTERCIAYKQAIGDAEFKRRHSVNLQTAEQVLADINATSVPTADVAAAIVADAIKATVPPPPSTTPLVIEGDRTTWHIRLYAQHAGVEVWILYNGEDIASSPNTKQAVAQWRDDELAKLVQKPVEAKPVAAESNPALASIDLGHEKWLKFQRSVSNGNVRAVIASTNGVILFRGPVVPEAQAARSRFDVMSQMTTAAIRRTHGPSSYQRPLSTPIDDNDDDEDEEEED